MEGSGRWGTHGRERVALVTRENNPHTTYTHPAPQVPHTYSTHPLAPHSPCKPHMPHMVHALPHVIHTLPLTPLCMVAPWWPCRPYRPASCIPAWRCPHPTVGHAPLCTAARVLRDHTSQVEAGRPPGAGMLARPTSAVPLARTTFRPDPWVTSEVHTEAALAPPADTAMARSNKSIVFKAAVIFPLC